MSVLYALIKSKFQYMLLPEASLFYSGEVVQIAFTVSGLYQQASGPPNTVAMQQIILAMLSRASLTQVPRNACGQGRVVPPTECCMTFFSFACFADRMTVQ